MKNANQILKAIMTKLGMEVKLEQMLLDDGVTAIEADMFEAGNEVFIVNEDERIPLPVGEYKLENGMLLVVSQEGIIGEIKEMEVEEEMPQEEVAADATATAEPVQPQPKVVTESIVKEYKFTQEEMDAKDAEIEALKAQITELSKQDEEATDIVEFEQEPKPISYNPENVQEVTNEPFVKIPSRRDSILESVYNIK